MTTTKWRCPKHNISLRTVEGFTGALVHDSCPEIFTVIDDHLCILEGNKWKNVKTGETRVPPKEG